MFNSHNFDSDWDYYDWIEFRGESWNEPYDEYEDREDGGEDEQEVDGMGDDG